MYSEILSRHATEACGENFLAFPFISHSRKEARIFLKAEELESSVEAGFAQLLMILVAILRPPLCHRYP
jgi:hypothetical protein